MRAMNAAALIPVLAMAAFAGLLGSDAYAQGPAAPVITHPTPDDAVIYSNSVTIAGTSEFGHRITIVDSSNAPLGGTLVTSAAGDWSVDIPMADGTRIIVALAFPNPADFSVSVPSDPLVITVSGGASVVDTHMPVITSPAPGTIVTGGAVTLQGTALPFSIIYISDASRVTLANTVADADGNWQAAISLPNGMHTPVAVSIDSSGAFLRSVPITVFVTDGVPPDPATPTVTYPASGTHILTNTFTATGTSEPGASIVIIDLFGKPVGFAVADGAGAWSAQVTDADGAHFYTAIASKAGSRSYHSDPFLVYVGLGEANPDELPLPTITSPAPGALITDGDDVLIYGTAAPSTLVEVVDLYRVPLGVTYADGSGQWSVTVRLEDGLHTLSAIYYTAGGAPSGHSVFSIVHVDSRVTALDRPVITSPASESVHDSDSAIAISGTAAPNSMIKILNFDAEIATAASDGTGAWSATVQLPNGFYLISAVASTGGATGSSNSEIVMLFVNDPAPSARVCR